MRKKITNCLLWLLQENERHRNGNLAETLRKLGYWYDPKRGEELELLVNSEIKQWVKFIEDYENLLRERAAQEK